MPSERARSKARTVLLGASLLVAGAVFGALAAAAWLGGGGPDEPLEARSAETVGVEFYDHDSDPSPDPEVADTSDREPPAAHPAPDREEASGSARIAVEAESEETSSEATVKVTDESGAKEAPSGDTGAGTAEAEEVDRILAQAEAAYSGLETLRARFDQEVHVPLLDRRRQGHGIWYQKGKSRFKMDFEDPPDDVIVADGVHLWLYYPSTNPRQVIRQSLDAPTPSAATADVLGRILEEARTSYAGSYGGRETVDGTATHRIDLRPLLRSPYRSVRVWIGTSDHLVRQFEIVEENETIRTVTLRDLEPNAPIPDETFRFSPPADADVFAG